MNHKRICMVAYTHYRTDPRCRREAEALAARGDRVDFVCLGDQTEPTTEMIEGVRVRRLKMGRYRGGSSVNYFISYASFFAKAFAVVTRLALKERLDVVHVHSLPDQMVFTAAIAKLRRSRVILDLHDLSPELYAERFRLAQTHPLIKLLVLGESLSARWSDGILCVHEPQARHLAARSRLRRPPCVVMNVPDPRLFGKPAVERLNVDVRGNAGTQCGFRIVHHGTLVERYGADLALLAFAEAVSAMPDAHFYLYGTGDFRPELKRHVDRLNLAQRAHLSDGALPLDAMPSVLAGADIGVVPHRDGPIMKWALPTKMMEYVALGIPVIVARTEVISEYFDDSMVMFFEPGNASDLARCILKLYREPELRRSLARNAARFLEEHSWDKEKLKLYSLVDSLTS